MRKDLSNLTDHQKYYRRCLKGRLWRIKNPQGQKQKQDRIDNPEKYKAIKRRTYLKNREKHLAANRRRSEIIAKSMNALSNEQVNLVNTIYEYSNRISKCTGIKHNVDHILPFSSTAFTALHFPSNLRVIPAVINSRKSNKIAI